MLVFPNDLQYPLCFLLLDFPEQIQYLANSGKQKVASGASLQWCDHTCVPDQVTLQMQLATKHIGKGCDRDTYSITSQRKLCGKLLGFLYKILILQLLTLFLLTYILPIFFEHIFMFFGFFEKLLQNNVKVSYVYNTFQNSYLWSFTVHWLLNYPWQIILTRFSPFNLVYTLFSPTSFSPTNTN